MKCTVGYRLRVFQEARRATLGLDAPLRDGELHLDRHKHLSDFVVQVTRDRPALLLLHCDKLRREPLQIDGGLELLELLALQVTFEPDYIHRGENGDRQATRERASERLPDLPLRDRVNGCDRILLLHERAAI